MLQKATNIPPPMSIFADTEDAQINSFTVQKIFKNETETRLFCEKNDFPFESVFKNKRGEFVVQCNVNFIDTPGLFELKKIGSKARDNDTLKKTILKCMEHQINKIHMIMFVCSFSGGINIQDIQSFIQFSKLFEGAEDTMAMAITRTEHFTEPKKVNLLNQLKDYKFDFNGQQKSLVEIIGEKNIFFTGALDREKIKSGLVAEVYSDLRNITRTRKILLNKIIDSEKYCKIKNIGFIQNYEQDVINLMKEWIEEHKNKPSLENLEGDHNYALEKLRMKIDDLKSFIVSNVSRDLYIKIIDTEISEKIPSYRKLLLKKLDENNCDEKEEKEMLEFQVYFENNKSFILKSSPSFDSFNEIVGMQFKILVNQFYNQSTFEQKSDIISKIQSKKASLFEEQLNEYSKVIQEYSRLKKEIK
jgi:hypothetical protein